MRPRETFHAQFMGECETADISAICSPVYAARTKQGHFYLFCPVKTSYLFKQLHDSKWHLEFAILQKAMPKSGVTKHALSVVGAPLLFRGARYVNAITRWGEARRFSILGMEQKKP